jgi:hypothetical protein
VRIGQLYAASGVVHVEAGGAIADTLQDAAVPAIADKESLVDAGRESWPEEINTVSAGHRG